MRLAWASLCALLLFAAHPAVTFAQYQERWSTTGFSFGSPSLAPGNLGDFDGDGSWELVGQIKVGGMLYLQIRDALTGAIEFTSTTAFLDDTYQHWTTYLLNIDGNPNDQEILAGIGAEFVVIDYVGTVSAPANEVQGMRETLLPARPNPFGSQVSLSYTLAAPGRAELEIYDVAGRQVRRIGGDRVEAGEHRVDWDGRDQDGRSLQPGMYFYRLNVDGRASEAQKAVRLGQ